MVNIFAANIKKVHLLRKKTFIDGFLRHRRVSKISKGLLKIISK
jgi:hypothetical protein